MSAIDRISRRLALRRFGAAALGVAGATVAARSADAVDLNIDLNLNLPICLNTICHTAPGSCNAGAGCVCCGYRNPITKTVINSRCRQPAECTGSFNVILP